MQFYRSVIKLGLVTPYLYLNSTVIIKYQGSCITKRLVRIIKEVLTQQVTRVYQQRLYYPIPTLPDT